MKTIWIAVPDNLAERINEYVREGFFVSEPDVVLAAMSEFVRRNRVDLMVSTKPVIFPSSEIRAIHSCLNAFTKKFKLQYSVILSQV